MLKRRWIALACFACACVVAALPVPGFGDDGTGGTVCKDPNNPKCDVYVGTPKSPGKTEDGKRDTGNDTSGDSGLYCIYEPANPSPEVIASLGGQPAGEGGWYFKTCYQPDGIEVAYPGPIWIAGSPPRVTPESLARQARSRLQLPAVVIRLNPAGEQLVNLPTWLALDASSWESRSATASVPGVSVTATARPLKAEWSLGDGGTVTCTGPGSVW